VIYFFDTSALIKHYILETGSKTVDDLMTKAKGIRVSSLYRLESMSVIRRLLKEKMINRYQYDELKINVDYDFNYFDALPITSSVEELAYSLIDTHQLKTLDSIQLASCMLFQNVIDCMVVCDQKLIKAAQKEGLIIINPMEAI
jgi:predicted nucleic acid-binding protein